MSIDLFTDTAAGVSRPRSAEPPGESTAAKRSEAKERKAAEVSLDATKEMDALVQVVRQAPTEVSEARLDQLATEVRKGEYAPNMQTAALRILEELEVLPDPPYDIIP